MSDASLPKFLSQADFAKRRKVSRKAVTVWKQKGLLVFSEDGKVDVEQSEWSLDQRPATYRGGVAHRPVRAAGNDRQRVARPKVVALPVAEPSPRNDDGGDGGDDEALDYLASINLPMAEAVRRKENALGLRRVHELEVARLEWVRVDEVGLVVEREYATVRERLLTIPGKIAEALVGATRAEIEVAIRAEITEALNELHDPAGVAGRVVAGGPAAGGSPGPSAAPGP